MKSPINWMLLLVPIAIALEVMHADPLYVFIACALGIIPLSGWMGRATEWMAEHLGSGIGGLLNATFGNAAELIIALVALRAGLNDVVKASITGSIIGNILLVLGVAFVAGGVKSPKLQFNRTAASLSSTLLALSTVALIVPALFHRLSRLANPQPLEQTLSMEISIVLLVTYILSLVFTLRTHKHLYVGEGDKGSDEGLGMGHVPLWVAIVILLVATAFVALLSEFLVTAIEPTARRLGMSDVFVGVFVVAIVGNAAEHSTAVLVARKNKMDLAVNIAVGSSLQIALLVAPLLVFASYAFGKPLDLLFTTFEIAAVTLSVAILNLITIDGESNWMEGVLLLAVYTILGLAFYTMPS
ncbi:MAG TPA: calcium/proton exchanger [Terriglobia bacterium]|nr:calcium/proton exchanger [Terriglobia bacterium]